MKSTKKQLEGRGFVPEEALAKYRDIPDDEIGKLLNGQIARERTIGARIAKDKRKEKWLPVLCRLLENEKKLYTKIALSEAIQAYGVSSMKHLVPLLGKVGNNQHKKAALVDIDKKSYPLPRDIVERVIARIGEPALPLLEEVLASGTYRQKTEAIDAIGHIAFNFNRFRSEKPLHELFEKSTDDELIQWKIVRAFQSFGSKEVGDRLKRIIEKSDNETLKTEARRSLRQIEKRKNKLPNG